MTIDITKDNVVYRDLYSEFIDFSVKRTERLTSALYLVSELIPMGEPLKMLLRQKGLGILSDIFALTIFTKENKEDAWVKIMSEISELMSLIRVASVGGLISDMNSNILQKEYAHLHAFFESRRKNDKHRLGKEIIFNEDFFGDDEYQRINLVGVQKHKGHDKRHQINKGHDNISYKTSIIDDKQQIENITKNTTQITEKSALIEKNITNENIVQEERKRSIVQLIKDSNGNVNIKDIASHIKGCSEKTLQRDLIYLMQKGTIKKIGERRWSRYFLA